MIQAFGIIFMFVKSHYFISLEESNVCKGDVWGLIVTYDVTGNKIYSKLCVFLSNTLCHVKDNSNMMFLLH